MTEWDCVIRSILYLKRSLLTDIDSSSLWNYKKAPRLHMLFSGKHHIESPNQTKQTSCQSWLSGYDRPRENCLLALNVVNVWPVLSSKTRHMPTVSRPCDRYQCAIRRYAKLGWNICARLCSCALLGVAAAPLGPSEPDVKSKPWHPGWIEESRQAAKSATQPGCRCMISPIWSLCNDIQLPSGRAVTGRDFWHVLGLDWRAVGRVHH